METPFDNFLGNIDNVPPELQRNFHLIRELDEKTQEVMGRIEECMVQYKESNSRSDRKSIQQDTKDLFDRIDGYAEDKIRLSIQTYDLIDKNIVKLVQFVNDAAVNINSDEEADKFIKPPGYEMPHDPNEPTFCVCNQIEHGDMIACENKDCDIEWFHFACVGITEAPVGNWYCGECLPKMKAEYSRRKSASKRRRR